MVSKWIAIVSRAGARIFNEQGFQLIAELPNPLGREKNRAMSDGKPGVARAANMSRSNLHSLTGGKDPHEDAAVQFARILAEFLRKQFYYGRFSTVVVAAEPRMAGLVKAQLDKHLAGHVEWWKKDLGKVPDLPARLGRANKVSF